MKDMLQLLFHASGFGLRLIWLWWWQERHLCQRWPDPLVAVAGGEGLVGRYVQEIKALVPAFIICCL